MTLVRNLGPKVQIALISVDTHSGNVVKSFEQLFLTKYRSASLRLPNQPVQGLFDGIAEIQIAITIPVDGFGPCVWMPGADTEGFFREIV